jgi:tRNA(fMet)-specific endonuclease VapC
VSAASASRYCFDTDVLSSLLRPNPSLEVIRRVAAIPARHQFTTAITLGELLYGAEGRGSASLAERIRDLLRGAIRILPFDEDAARIYGSVRARLEASGRRLDEPDLRIASIAIAADLTLVSGNTRHFTRVPGLTVENWLQP